MRIYKYKNATVYITEPTKEHIQRIKKATEVFLKKVVKERSQNVYVNSSRGVKK